MAALDAISAFGNVFTNMLGLGLQESQNRRTNELDWKINQDNIFAAKEINESQLAAARENWKREQSNFEKQREWSIQDRAFENEYNSPYQQRLRYLRAGLNPALMMEGQGSVGSVNASTGQAPNFGSPPSMVPVENKFHYTPMDYSGLGTGFKSTMDLYMMARQQDTDIAATRQRVFNESLKTISDINKQHWESESLKEEVTKLALDNAFNQDSFSDRLSTVHFQADLMKANSDLAAENAKTQKLINEFKPKEQEAILKNLGASYSQIMSAVRSNDADAAYKAALESITKAQKEGVDIDNAVKEELAGIQVDKALIENDALYWNTQQSAKEFQEGGLVGKYMPGAGIDGSQYDYNSKSSRGRRRLIKRDGKYVFGYEP